MGKLASIFFTVQRNLSLSCPPGFGIAVVRKILILSSLCIGLEMAAQADSYSILHFTNENGLPQNTIKGIEIDKKGFVWLATEVGLARYDGYRFQLYNQLNSPKLSADRIVRMARMRDQHICRRYK